MGGVALDTQRMRVMKTFDNDWDFEFEMSRPRVSSNTVTVARQLKVVDEDEKKTYGVAGGVVEQARVVLDQLQVVLANFGIDVEVPQWITSLDGAPKSFSNELLNCILDSIGDATKAIMCPMKFASAGIDVISGITGPSDAEPASATSSSRIKDALWRDFSSMR